MPAPFFVFFFLFFFCNHVRFSYDALTLARYCFLMTTATLKQRLQTARNSKGRRIWLLVVLLLILLAMYFIGGKMKGLLLVLIVVVLSALGLQLTDWDLDLQTLRQTGSLQESRVEYKQGLKILWSDCVSDTLNCANFTTQPEAQAKYEACAAKIAADNAWATNVKSLDIYGLDGDNDGIVCEALAK